MVNIVGVLDLGQGRTTDSMLAKVIFPQQELHFFLQINLSRFLYVFMGTSILMPGHSHCVMLSFLLNDY